MLFSKPTPLQELGFGQHIGDVVSERHVEDLHHLASLAFALGMIQEGGFLTAEPHLELDWVIEIVVNNLCTSKPWTQSKDTELCILGLSPKKRKQLITQTPHITIGPSKPTSPIIKQRTWPTTRKTPKPFNPPPPSSASSDKSELLPTNLNLEELSTNEDDWEDEEPKQPCHTRTMAAIPFPTATLPQDPSVTLENYNKLLIAGKTVSKYLHKFSIRKKHNFYQNFLKYSLESTQANMAAQNTPEGFKNLNQYLGSTWTNLKPEKKTYSIGWEQPLREPETGSLKTDEQDIYLPIFKQLVDLDKIAQDLGLAKFGSHLPTARQNKSREEVEHIDHELQTIHIQYGVHYALMTSLWNPHTSLTPTKWKLLEHFVWHLARSNLEATATKAKKPKASNTLKA
ncbi:hypothetical protein DFH28DRAFT_932545 [Melampsora americana]|nr:hypothetical protein DFH28DRAFT_932545 [Melampsora americana]